MLETDETVQHHYWQLIGHTKAGYPLLQMPLGNFEAAKLEDEDKLIRTFILFQELMMREMAKREWKKDQFVYVLF
jgi:hypothetical protein